MSQPGGTLTSCIYLQALGHFQVIHLRSQKLLIRKRRSLSLNGHNRFEESILPWENFERYFFPHKLVVYYYFVVEHRYWWEFD